jgi:hypothetical protein
MQSLNEAASMCHEGRNSEKNRQESKTLDNEEHHPPSDSEFTLHLRLPPS